MIGASERRTIEFLNWESRGRGHAIWPHPVTPEPLFAPFYGKRSSELVTGYDDAKRETFLSRAVRKMSERLSAPPPIPREEPEPEETPPILVRDDLAEIQAHLPAKLGFDASAYAGLFTSLTVCAEPIAFELVATSERITPQFAVHPRDERLVRRQLHAFLSDVEFNSVSGALTDAWGDSGQPHLAIAEFGLGREFVIPLDAGRGEPFVGIVGALEEIEPDEIAVFQVIFAPTRFPWSEQILYSVTHGDGSALFTNAPELLDGAKRKTAQPLFAAIVRVAARSPRHERSWEIVCNVAGALGAYGSVRGNELVPLKNDGYPPCEHELDLLARQTHRSGMLLGVDELAAFVHLPSSEVRSRALRPETGKTRAAPARVRNADGLVLGINEHAGTETPVVLTDELRALHAQVIGASGTGKSTLLFNLIQQDLERGYGCTVLDPHGTLIDRILGAIPDHRIRDVVLLDASDEEHVVGFNVLVAHSDWEKNLLASDLVAVFRRLSTSWGDQLNSVLSNALLAFMESDRGGTLLDVRRFLLEPRFRADFLKTVRDPNVLYYWQHGFPALTGNKSVGPVTTRLDAFLSPKALRYMVAQRENKLGFSDILDSGKIFLAKLPEGLIGKENAHLLGSFLISKILSAAMSRQRRTEQASRFHTLYVDEFHSFLTPSLAEGLHGVRKYDVGFVLAHQETRQVERDAEVASALRKVGTRIVFRVGDDDARTLQSGFSSFEARDMQNLERGHAVCRVERSDWDFNLRVEAPEYPDERAARERRAAVVAESRRQYATPRAAVERALSKQLEAEASPPRSERAEPLKPPVRADPVADPRESTTTAAPLAGEQLTVEKSVLPAPTIVVEPVAPAAPAEEKKPKGGPGPVADLGKGGAQHKAIQDRIKEEAEKLGFRVSVEQNFPGLGQIDLVLSRESVSVACEVEVEGTIDYAVKNASKCLKAGFSRIAVVGASEDKLAKLSAAVANSLGAEKAQSVAYFLPDAFITSLRELPKFEPAVERVVRTRGGRVVRRKVVTISPEEAKAKEDEVFRVMATLMRSKKRAE